MCASLGRVRSSYPAEICRPLHEPHRGGPTPASPSHKRRPRETVCFLLALLGLMAAWPVPCLAAPPVLSDGSMSESGGGALLFLGSFDEGLWRRTYLHAPAPFPSDGLLRRAWRTIEEDDVWHLRRVLAHHLWHKQHSERCDANLSAFTHRLNQAQELYFFRYLEKAQQMLDDAAVHFPCEENPVEANALARFFVLEGALALETQPSSQGQNFEHAGQSFEKLRGGDQGGASLWDSLAPDYLERFPAIVQRAAAIVPPARRGVSPESPLRVTGERAQALAGYTLWLDGQQHEGLKGAAGGGWHLAQLVGPGEDAAISMSWSGSSVSALPAETAETADTSAQATTVLQALSLTTTQELLLASVRTTPSPVVQEALRQFLQDEDLLWLVLLAPGHGPTGAQALWIGRDGTVAHQSVTHSKNQREVAQLSTAAGLTLAAGLGLAVSAGQVAWLYADGQAPRAEQLQPWLVSSAVMGGLVVGGTWTTRHLSRKLQLPRFLYPIRLPSEAEPSLSLRFSPNSARLEVLW